MVEWYSYGEFSFRRCEVLWALHYAEEFRDGKWPCQNIISGYTDPGIRTQRVKKEPAFVKPAIVMAETDARLEKTGVDGKLLLAEVEAEYELFSDEAWMALNYVSGWKRKRQLYVDFKKQTKYRSKGGYMPRFNQKQDLSKIQIQERAKRKRNKRR